MSKRGFSDFLQFLTAAHILKVNCDEMPEDRPRQPADDFSDPNADPLCSRRPAHVNVKEGYNLKSGYFTDIASSSMKTVAR